MVALFRHSFLSRLAAHPLRARTSDENISGTVTRLSPTFGPLRPNHARVISRART